MAARWVLTWKIDSSADKVYKSFDNGKTWFEYGLDSSGWSGRQWKVKARLAVRGFQDYQKEAVGTCSPTTSHTGQRRLIALAVRRNSILQSFFISAALLQGRELQGVSTKAGDQRIAGMRPPFDRCSLLRDSARERDTENPKSSDEMRRACDLHCALYGLGGAPALFHDELKACF